MLSYLKMIATTLVFTLFMALPVALCIILDTRMNTPPPVPLPEPPGSTNVVRAFDDASEPVVRSFRYRPDDVLRLGDLRVGDTVTLADGTQSVRFLVTWVGCDCTICQEYRGRYPDWESTSHYHKAHKDALKRP